MLDDVVMDQFVSRGGVSSWPRLDDYLDILQTEANGGVPGTKLSNRVEPTR